MRRNNRAASVLFLQLATSKCLFAEVTRHLSLFTMQLNVSLHADLIMQYASITLRAWSVFALHLLVTFNLGQTMYLKAVRIVHTSELSELKDLGETWLVHSILELALLGLLTVAALTPASLPISDAWLTVDC